MALVTLAAFFVALLFVLFRAFELRRIPLFPAIVINYVVACAIGMLISRPWEVPSIHALIPASAGMGVLFITVFFLTGLSTQRNGVAPTTVASKMSLVLTVMAAVFLYDDRPGLLGWIGIALAVVGVALASWQESGSGRGGAWLILLVLFIGNGAVDIAINWVQVHLLGNDNAAVFPTLVFGAAAFLGICWSALRKEIATYRQPRVWIGGAVLGAANYAALYFVVKALADSGMPASSVFPLINIGVILFGTMGSILLFRELVVRRQWQGIVLSIIALCLILLAPWVHG